MRFHVEQVHWPTVRFPELNERKVDLVLARLAGPLDGSGQDLQAEVLFDDPFSAVVGPNSKWGRRRRLDLTELADEQWLMTPLDVLAGHFVTEAFEACGLKPPTPLVASYSTYLRTNLASRSQYIAVLPRSVLLLNASQYSLKELPIRLSSRPSPVAVVTLKNRTLTPAVQVFIEYAREIAGSLFDQKKPAKR